MSLLSISEWRKFGAGLLILSPTDRIFLTFRDLTSVMATTDAGEASRIRELRQQLGWSQRRAADHAGVSLSTIKRLETRGAGHNRQRVKRSLEAALDAPHQAGPAPRDVVDSFVTASGEPPSVMVREFLALLDTLSIEQQWAAVRTFALTVTALARARGEIPDDAEPTNR
jgi:transcriptional regulator with XRE-family HTH domain